MPDCNTSEVQVGLRCSSQPQKIKSVKDIQVSWKPIYVKWNCLGAWAEVLNWSWLALFWKSVLTNSSTVWVRGLMFPIQVLILRKLANWERLYGDQKELANSPKPVLGHHFLWHILTSAMNPIHFRSSLKLKILGPRKIRRKNYLFLAPSYKNSVASQPTNHATNQNIYYG